MNIAEVNGAPTRLEGRFSWILGLGSVVSWNSMLTIGDYYYKLFPEYHPARVLTLVYQPFTLGTIATLSYYESRIDTRRRNITGYNLFFLSTLLLLVLDLATQEKEGLEVVLLCVLVLLWGCICLCSRWNGWRLVIHEPQIHPIISSWCGCIRSSDHCFEANHKSKIPKI